MNEKNPKAPGRGASFKSTILPNNNYNNFFFFNAVTLMQPPPTPSSKQEEADLKEEAMQIVKELEARRQKAAAENVPSLQNDGKEPSYCELTHVWSKMDTGMIRKALGDPKLAPMARAFMDVMGMQAAPFKSKPDLSVSADLSPSSDLSPKSKASAPNKKAKRRHSLFSSTLEESQKRPRPSSCVADDDSDPFADMFKDEEFNKALDALCDPYDENDVPSVGSMPLALNTTSSGDVRASPCISSASPPVVKMEVAKGPCVPLVATKQAVPVAPPPTPKRVAPVPLPPTPKRVAPVPLPPTPKRAAPPSPTPKRSAPATKPHKNKKTNIAPTKKLPQNTPKSDPPQSTSPQQYLNKLLTSRGYSISSLSSVGAGYHTKPSPLQLASFGTKLVRAVHERDVDLLSSLLSCGLSRNPCNKYGDSIVNLVCKRGDGGLFRCLLDNGCEVRVADDWGRTPLHYAAWAGRPCFDSVEGMLAKDLNLLRVLDKRGVSPLDYITKDRWHLWVEFLESKKDVYFPPNGKNPNWKEQIPRLHRKNDKFPDPDDALSVDLAESVASGKIQPEDITKNLDARKLYKKSGWMVRPPQRKQARRFSSAAA